MLRNDLTNSVVHRHDLNPVTERAHPAPRVADDRKACMIYTASELYRNIFSIECLNAVACLFTGMLWAVAKRMRRIVGSVGKQRRLGCDRTEHKSMRINSV